MEIHTVEYKFEWKILMNEFSNDVSFLKYIDLWDAQLDLVAIE